MKEKFLYLQFEEAIQAQMQAHADPQTALAQAAYLRHLFPFLGLKKPLRAELLKGVLVDFPILKNDFFDKKAFYALLERLWLLPEREYQYLVLNLLEKKGKKNDFDEGFILLLERFALSKSWWDSVDGIAPLVGLYFKKYPQNRMLYLPKWYESKNIWLQRLVLIFQLSYKENTDTELLFKYIRLLSAEKEFFIQKAIGWALRQYARTDAQAVRLFVEQTPLAALSKREALKHLK
ncbi:DNA alkylation repair protein [Hugenholtzia roseola]|uniref:DNA alkylation repair protein n=1 Tax=Hugenholtzia roseola TaxID=1002 RepID=UPI0003FC75A3|nr:DNA alkylation repair protein [Hugenholtzia roseola]